MRHFVGFTGIPPSVAPVGVGAGLRPIFISGVMLEFEKPVETFRNFPADSVSLTPQTRQTGKGSYIRLAQTVVGAVKMLENAHVEAGVFQLFELIITAVEPVKTLAFIT